VSRQNEGIGEVCLKLSRSVFAALGPLENLMTQAYEDRIRTVALSRTFRSILGLPIGSSEREYTDETEIEESNS
jgi:hypothetical protein